MTTPLPHVAEGEPGVVSDVYGLQPLGGVLPQKETSPLLESGVLLDLTKRNF